MKNIRPFAAFLAALAALPSRAQTPTPRPVLVTAARLLDVRSGKVLEGRAVLVRGDRIAEVGEAAGLRRKAPDADVVDLGGATLLPGLIDAHDHLTGDPR